MFNNGQAEARAANLACPAPIRTVEPFEDPRLMFGKDALARIGNTDNPSSVGFFKLYSYRSAGPIELDPIIYQIREHLLQSGRVRKHGRFLRYQVFDRYIPRFCLGRERSENIVND